jgi:hypothetical protein
MLPLPRGNKRTKIGTAIGSGYAVKKCAEEKHEPVSDIETVVVDSLKALDPKRPITEADIRSKRQYGTKLKGIR